MFLKRALFANLAILGANAIDCTAAMKNHIMTASDIHDSTAYTIGEGGKALKSNSSQYMWVGLDMLQDMQNNIYCLAFTTSIMSDEYHFGVSKGEDYVSFYPKKKKVWSHVNGGYTGWLDTQFVLKEYETGYAHNI